jgi:hypothetical protein
MWQPISWSVGQLRVVRAVSPNIKADAEGDQPGHGVPTVPIRSCVDEGCVMVVDEMLVRQIDEFALAATNQRSMLETYGLLQNRSG